MVSIWQAELLPASWRGFPFFVEESEIPSVGRRLVIKEYPYRNNPSVEDLGRQTQRVKINGFINSQLIPAWNQRKVFMDFCKNVAGVGLLVHPSLGAVWAFLENSNFAESVEFGGVVRFQLEFVLAPTPSVITTADTIGLLIIQAVQAIGTFAMVFGALMAGGISGLIGGALGLAGGLIGVGLGVVSGLGATVLTVLGDAALPLGALAGLDILLNGAATQGRFLNGSLSSLNPVIDSVDTTLATVPAYNQAVGLTLANLTTTRAATLATVQSLAAPLAQASLVDFDPVAYAGLVSAGIEQLRLVFTAPSDQIRLLTVVYNSLVTGTDPFSALLRCSVLASMLNAVAATVLVSSQDATDLLDSLLPLYDNEIGVTTDPNAFTAVCDMKSALSSDLLTRGLQLPEIITITRLTALPSFVIAYQQYADATRADEISARNEVYHPLFCGLSLEVLSS